MTRRSAGALLVLALVTIALGGLGRAAHAQPAGAGTLMFDQRFATDNDPATLFYDINPIPDVYLHMNRAACLCAEKYPTNKMYQMGVYMTLSGVTTPLDNPMTVWTGLSACDDAARSSATQTCFQVPGLGVTDFNSISTSGGVGFYLAPVPVNYFIEPGKPTGGCSPTVGTNTVFALVATTDQNTMGSQGYNFDTLPPQPPTNFDAEGGEKAIQISFDIPAAGTTDIAYYQALCEDVSDSTPPFTNPDTQEWASAHDSTRGALGSQTIQYCGLPTTEIELDPAPVTGTATGIDAPDANPFEPDGTPDAATDVVDAPLSAPDAMPPPATLPTELQNLDPRYVCGTITGSGNSMRIVGLKNGHEYAVVLLAIDAYGNARGSYLTHTVMPKPVTDFWEDLHDDGSQVDSGFCLISDTYGDGGPITNAMRAFRDDTLGASGVGRAFTRFYYAHVAWLGEYAHAWWPLRIVLAIVLFPLIVLALAWHVLTLPGLLALAALVVWTRRRRRRARHPRLAIASAASLIVLAIGAGAAHAQDSTAYWNGGDDDDQTADDVGTAESTWIGGIKVGPYVPDIDAQFQAQTNIASLKTYRPYHHMFGGYNIMPVVEADRVLFDWYGQFTVGGSLSYLGKVAHAYDENTMPGDPTRPRSPGDTTSFRMVPITVEVGYRFTYLDDRYGVPIVPYVKGGLAYDVWWMNDPNGGFSYVGDDNCHTDPATAANAPCTQAKQTALGGSAGLVGSVGLLLRAERIDADAASSMRNGGLLHAGFYAELEASWIDWFGASNRLSVGDRTWFGGFAFEF